MLLLAWTFCALKVKLNIIESTVIKLMKDVKYD